MTNSSTVIVWITVFAVAYSYSIISSLYIQKLDQRIRTLIYYGSSVPSELLFSKTVFLSFT